MSEIWNGYVLKGDVSAIFGKDGYSAYEVAVKNGFEGTEEEWLASLKGDKGDKGDAFVYEDFTEEQLAELKGEKGDKGDKGNIGEPGVYIGSGDMPDGYNVQIDPSGASFSPDDFANAEKVDKLSEEIAKSLKISIHVGELENSKVIIYNNGAVGDGSIMSVTDYVDVSTYPEITYKKIVSTFAEVAYGMAFYNANREYINGVSAIANGVVSGYTTETIPVPENAKYARFTVRTDVATYGEFEVYGGTYKIDEVQNEIACLTTELKTDYSIPVGQLIANSVVVYDSGILGYSSTMSATEWMDISHCGYVTYKRIVSTSSGALQGMAFYDTDYQYISGQRCVFGTVSGYTTETIPVPENAKYARFTVRADTETYGEFEVFGRGRLASEIIAESVNEVNSAKCPLSLHTMPRSNGVLNAIKRARQLTDVKWTPLTNIPRMSATTAEVYGVSEKFEDVFKAETEYTGIPYSRGSDISSNYGYGSFAVGIDVPIESFLTAVRNPDSVIKESEYNGIFNSSVYGCVCSSFASYVIGLSSFYTTTDFPNVQGINKIADLIGYDLRDLELCDILLYPTHHIAIVTDIIRSENGEVTYVELSEATTYGNTNKSYKGGLSGGVCRRIGWNVDDLHEYWGAYGVYRYDNIDEVSYEKSNAINVGDELDMQYCPDLPCMPYMGNRFNYRYGYIYNSNILIACNAYGCLRVKKDGALFNTYQLDGSTESVTVGFTERGEYEAYLCNVDSDGTETIKTMSCHWRVV